MAAKLVSVLSLRMRDDVLRPAFVQLGNDPVGVERLVGDQAAELGPLDQECDTDRVVALAGQQDEVDEVAQGIGER